MLRDTKIGVLEAFKKLCDDSSYPHITQAAALSALRDLNRLPAGTYVKSTFSKQLNDPERYADKVPEELYNIMLGFLHKAGKMPSTDFDAIKLIKDNLYLSLIDYFKVPRSVEAEAKSALIGNYISYKQSLLNERSITKGIVQINETPGGALQMQEFVAFKHHGTQHNEERQGYIFSKEAHYLAISNDIDSGFPRIHILRSPKNDKKDGETGQIARLVGSCSGINSSDNGVNIFSRKILFTRIEGDLPPSRVEQVKAYNLNIHMEKDITEAIIPESIMNMMLNTNYAEEGSISYF